MGWSCTKAAMDTLDLVSAWSRSLDGSSNGMPGGGFWETDGVEHDDGAITGAVFRESRPGYARHAGTFKIAPDGHIVRFPYLPLGAVPSIQRAMA